MEEMVQQRLVANWVGFCLAGRNNLNQTALSFSNLILAGERLDNSSVTSDRDDLTTSLKRFWEVESIGIESIESEISTKDPDFVLSIRFTGTRYYYYYYYDQLIGATLQARLVNSLLTTLEWNVELFYWVDSMTTLHWIRNDRNWKQYVQHRVTVIRDLSSVESWRFCPGSLNPAYFPSRGISAKELSSESIWFNGPEFLGKIEDEWPKCQATNQTESEEVLREVAKQPANVVRSLMANYVLPPVLDLNKVIDINRFSSLKKLLRDTAYVVRFIDALRAARQGKRPAKRKVESLTASEVKRAELMWIRSIQGASFAKEIAFLSSENAKTTAPI